jgi:TM2 domain-containing membrane protein YozV
MRNYVTNTSDKSKFTALVLCLLGGWIGLHHFYVGRISRGLIYLLTGGLFFIGVALDLIAILLGSFKDNVGVPLRR